MAVASRMAFPSEMATRPSVNRLEREESSWSGRVKRQRQRWPMEGSGQSVGISGGGGMDTTGVSDTLGTG